MPPDATSKEIPVTNSQTIETDIQCECGEWSGERCAWSGPRSETTAVECMPAQHRASHTAAHNRGVYPHNGAIRIRVSPECAKQMVEHDAWVSVLEGEVAESVSGVEPEPISHAQRLVSALQWARDAVVGEYLVEYEDDDLTDVTDSGSRCGFGDRELAEINSILGRRNLTLTADDRGLVAQAVRS